MYKLISLLALFCVGTMLAQNRMGDYVGTASWNDDVRGSDRILQYVPHEDAFYCVNGENRFTRALYGDYTSYRLETGDRPVFALFLNSESARNVQFDLTYNGVRLPLDSTDFCESFYSMGQRRYRLRDHRWGNGELRISAACLNNKESALWEFATEGFAGEVVLQVKIHDVFVKKMVRNGDLGVDDPHCFEAEGEPLFVQTWKMGGSVVSYACADRFEIRVQVDGKEEFERNTQENWETGHRIEFQTPDPFLNSLDDALMFASEGAWDGETWLHGAIGWRTPLNGWRAGYLSDVLGWPERAISHFNAYAESQVTQVPTIFPHPAQDARAAYAVAEKKWGTPMYSDGYICSKPHRNDQMNHYDMNLNYIDALLWHFQYDADTAYMRQMWPVIVRHLAWEKRNFDPDGDHLYDAYCCIWASDALYYSGGAVTHSSAYNYRGNLLAAKIAEKIGEDGSRYLREAEAILEAMDNSLWVSTSPDVGHWAEYRDLMGLQRVHEDAAIWSVYIPVDCELGSPAQRYQSTRYVDEHIPHIPLEFTVPAKYYSFWPQRSSEEELYLVSTSDWMPYNWSLNNVASSEIMNLALAYFKAGRPDEGYRLLKGNIMDQMYVGISPGNFGQLSFYDAARGECYRDFSDNTGVSARALIQGLFGIVPQALDGLCILRPGFPADWDEVSIRTPYLSYSFRRENGKDIYEIHQNFKQPLKIIFRQNLGDGRYLDHEGTSDPVQCIEIQTAQPVSCQTSDSVVKTVPDVVKLGLADPTPGFIRRTAVDLSSAFNAEVDDIFKQQYLSPRPAVTTLQIPVQGVGEWCHPLYLPEINDSVFRTCIRAGTFEAAGIRFSTPVVGKNVIYTSLWDNFPNEAVVTLEGKARFAYLLLAGSTNPMQTHIDNAWVLVDYQDGSRDTLRLLPPFNWCPIEQDYFVDGKAFSTVKPRPIRICLGTGDVSRDLGALYQIKAVYGRELPGGAIQMLKMPLNPRKRLHSLTLRVLSNDVVVGLMAVTLEK